jgi:fimbrial chaperone protein
MHASFPRFTLVCRDLSMIRSFVFCLCLIASWPISIVDASAASLQVSPIRVDLDSERPAAMLTLHNDGPAPLDAQVRVFAWSQTLDEDRLEPTPMVIATPPIAHIEPGDEQTVRLLRVGRAPISHEETYRVIVDELPGGATSQSNGVRVQLRYSVPVFASAKESQAAAPALSFALQSIASADGTPMLMLRASNDADTHAQLSSVRLDWPDGRSTRVTDGLLGYALPHATRRWPVADAPADASAATLHAVVNGTAITTKVLLEPAR